MRLSRSWVLVTALTQGFSLSRCLYIPPNAINGSLLSQYDYIVVGGGASGLVIANRLSEDSDVTVLVLEAGTLDTEGYTVTVPAEIGKNLGTDYDWQLHTVGQEYLNGKEVTINQGKVLGGGTVLNGMVWTRGSQKDYDSWDDLNTVTSQLKQYDWRWDDIFPYFLKSENFTVDVDTGVRQDLHINPDMEAHGDQGYVQVSYPHFFYEQSGAFLYGMEELGIPIVSEPNNGAIYGAFIAPSSMAAENQSRSDSRVAYLDKAVNRPNLHIATEQMVTRILLEEDAEPISTSNGTGFSSFQVATGVEFSHSAQEAKRNITCSKEVILAAGAIFSPTLLQVSGIGPSDELQSLNISVKIDLPGVGSNAQDHGMIHPIYLYTNTSLVTANTFLATNESREAEVDEYYTNRTGPLTAPMISTVAFPSLPQFADDWSALLQNASQRNVNETLPAGTHPSVRQGYIAQREHLLQLLGDATEGAVEFLADSIGTLSIAMQRPLSRGTVRPRSANIFDLPLVDPRYCSDPFDCIVVARALLFNCQLLLTSPIEELQPVVQAPYFCPNNISLSSPTGGNSSISSQNSSTINDMMLDLVRQNIVTEFHPSGTTAMLPLDLGGVVDTELVVYGTTNLRVVDAGVMPMVLGAHLQAGVYAIAERAADIIKVANR